MAGSGRGERNGYTRHGATPGRTPLWSPAPPRPPQTLAFDAGLHSGQTFALAPGDRVRFSYARAPAWRWKALP